MITLLLSSAGRRVELINCFREDARALGLELRVIAADAAPDWSAACQVADASFAIPRCDHPDFIPRLLELCAQQKVDLLVPTIDPELLPLAQHRRYFAERGTRVVISALTEVIIARDKLRTAAFLSEAGLPSPRSVRLKDLLGDDTALQFPVILKRIDGSSSIGLHEATNISEVRRLDLDPTHYLAQEKWIGREYTINLFFDRQGHLRSAVPHWRSATRGGEVSKGRTERVPALTQLAKRLGKAMPGAEGALCFQAIVTSDNQVTIFEINARFGGGFPLAHRAGAPFSRWLLEEAAGLPLTANDNWTEGVTLLRYDAAVFLPPLTP